MSAFQKLRETVPPWSMIIVVFAVCFAVAELGIRMLRPLTDDSHFYRSPRPYVEFSGRPNASRTPSNPSPMGGSVADAAEHLNELGFRGPLPPMPKGRERRILMLGGSTVYEGAPLEQTIAGQLQQLFEQDGQHNVRIYNWGVVSFVSGQELSLLTHVAPDYDPDLIIVYDGGNDIYSPFNYDPRPGYPYNWLIYEAGLDLLREGGALPLLLKSRLIRTFFPAITLAHRDEIREQVGYRTASWNQRIIHSYVSNLQKMCAVARGHNISLVVYLQPLLFFKSPLVGNESRLVGSQEFQEWTKTMYGGIRKETAQLAEWQQGCYFFDVSRAFAAYDTEVFWDFIHVSNKGNHHMATVIYHSLHKIFPQPS